MDVEADERMVWRELPLVKPILRILSTFDLQRYDLIAIHSFYFCLFPGVDFLVQ